jgi:hypothetical protein
MIKHKHHIIPRHAGGTDHPSNLIELTIEEHAEAHRILYEEHGRDGDKWAWLGLSGQVGKDEILRQIAKSRKGIKKPEGFGEKISTYRKTFKYSEESKLKMSNAKKGKVLSEEHRKKISLCQQGKKQPESQKQKVSEKLSKKYILTTPVGKTIEITNLRKYCKENGLDQGNMVKVSQGILKQHKGYTCYKVA